MDLKNLMSHAVRPVNPTTTGELPAPELAQLSEEDLLQIIGGVSINLSAGKTRVMAVYITGAEYVDSWSNSDGA